MYMNPTHRDMQGLHKKHDGYIDELKEFAKRLDSTYGPKRTIKLELAEVYYHISTLSVPQNHVQSVKTSGVPLSPIHDLIPCAVDKLTDSALRTLSCYTASISAIPPKPDDWARRYSTSVVCMGPIWIKLSNRCGISCCVRFYR